MAPHPTPLDLSALQREARALLAGVRHPRVGAALALSEETGEVCDLVLKRECYGVEVAPAALAGELADVLVCVAELADCYGVDLEAACRAKLAELAGRVPGWEASFGASLARARARMDAAERSPEED